MHQFVPSKLLEHVTWSEQIDAARLRESAHDFDVDPAPCHPLGQLAYGALGYSDKDGQFRVGETVATIVFPSHQPAQARRDQFEPLQKFIRHFWVCPSHNNYFE